MKSKKIWSWRWTKTLRGNLPWGARTLETYV